MEVTLESVVNAWRKAVEGSAFDVIVHEKRGHLEEALVLRHGLSLLIPFGVAAGLIASGEGDDWMDCLSGKVSMTQVMARWQPELGLGPALEGVS